MTDGIAVHLVIASPTTIGKPLLLSDGPITSPVATIPDFGAGGSGDRRRSARQRGSSPNQGTLSLTPPAPRCMFLLSSFLGPCERCVCQRSDARDQKWWVIAAAGGGCLGLRMRDGGTKKMSTFISAISPVLSMYYEKFMSTFAYPPEKPCLGKSRA